MSEMIGVTKLLLVGVVSGVFAATIATMRHRHEKWWEMRAAAYKSAIEALSDLHSYYQYQYENWGADICR